MSSRKAAANRRNARKSTGPVTAEGKARSSRNSTTHGIFARVVLLPGEDGDAFDRFKQEMFDTLNPRNALELTLVERVVDGYWKLKRIAPAEAQIMLQLANFDRLHVIDERDEQIGRLRDQLSDARKRLSHSRKDREQCQKDVDEAIRALEEAESHLDDEVDRPSPGDMLPMLLAAEDQAMEKLSRYEQRIENAIHRNLRELREMRKHQREEETEMQNEATEDVVDDNTGEEQELSSTDSIEIEEDIVQESEDEPQSTQRTQRTEKMEDDPLTVS